MKRTTKRYGISFLRGGSLCPLNWNNETTMLINQFQDRRPKLLVGGGKERTVKDEEECAMEDQK